MSYHCFVTHSQGIFDLPVLVFCSGNSNSWIHPTKNVIHVSWIYNCTESSNFFFWKILTFRLYWIPSWTSTHFITSLLIHQTTTLDLILSETCLKSKDLSTFRPPKQEQPLKMSVSTLDALFLHYLYPPFVFSTNILYHAVTGATTLFWNPRDQFESYNYSRCPKVLMVVLSNQSALTVLCIFYIFSLSATCLSLSLFYTLSMIFFCDVV